MEYNLENDKDDMLTRMRESDAEVDMVLRVVMQLEKEDSPNTLMVATALLFSPDTLQDTCRVCRTPDEQLMRVVLELTSRGAS